MTTSVFIPAFAGYEARVRESFARQGAMKLIGAAIDEVAPGYCAIALTPRQISGLIPNAAARRAEAVRRHLVPA